MYLLRLEQSNQKVEDLRMRMCLQKGQPLLKKELTMLWMVLQMCGLSALCYLRCSQAKYTLDNMTKMMLLQNLYD